MGGGVQVAVLGLSGGHGVIGAEASEMKVCESGLRLIGERCTGVEGVEESLSDECDSKSEVRSGSGRSGEPAPHCGARGLGVSCALVGPPIAGEADC